MFGSKKKESGSADDESQLKAALEHDVPWLRAYVAHNDRYMRLNSHADNWRRAAVCSWFITALMACWMGYWGSLEKFKTYVVEVDTRGHSRTVRSLETNDTRIDPERIIVAELEDLAINLRTVTTDREANNRNISKGLSRLVGGAKAYAITELRKAPPNEVGQVKTVQVKTLPPLKIGEKVWQIEWDEIAFNLNGEQIGPPERWKASVTTELKPSSDETIFKGNPYGFSGTQMNWTKVGVGS